MTDYVGKPPRIGSGTVSGFFSRYSGWMQKISGALLDQAVFAGSNFVINIILARHMTLDHYGAFVVVYTWFLLCQNMYDAFLTEPMAILGSGKYFSQLKEYLGYTFAGHVIVTLVLALLLGLGATVSGLFDTNLISGTMYTAALVCPILLTRWLTRQPFYIIAQPHWSALGGIIYFVIGLAGTVLLDRAQQLTPSNALLTMAVASAFSSLFLAVVFIKPRLNFRSMSLEAKPVLRDHWNYGKWSSGSKVANWIPINLYYVILPLLISLGASAALRAMNNVLMPLNMAISASLGILLPMFARTYTESGKEGLHKRLIQVLIAFIAVSGAYCFIFSFFGQPIVSILYDGQFDSFVTFPILLTMGLAPILVAINITLDAALRVMGKMKQSFISTLLPALLILTLGVALLSQFGLLGANLASLVIGVLATIIYLRFYQQARRVDPAQKSAETSDIPEPPTTLPL
ncbi:MAG: hypothetical protein IPK19_00405 [Chloroflexi bacterium]|nr:hypothetical protein [Chloroflexota bacterium]